MCWVTEIRFDQEKMVFEERDKDIHSPWECAYSSDTRGVSQKWTPIDHRRCGTGRYPAFLSKAGVENFRNLFDKEDCLSFYNHVKDNPICERELGDTLQKVGYLQESQRSRA